MGTRLGSSDAAQELRMASDTSQKETDENSELKVLLVQKEPKAAPCWNTNVDGGEAAAERGSARLRRKRRIILADRAPVPVLHRKR